MTATDRELGGLVREWLRPGTTTLSEGVFTRAMAEVSTTPQRRGTLPLRRWLALARTSRFALVGSTAIVIVAVVGLGLLLAPPGPRVGPNVVTPAATPRPTASPSLVPDASRAVIDLSNSLRVTFDVPVGWSRYGAASVGTENPLAPAGAEVSFYEADAVFKDPCNLDFLITQISGPTAADLVDAFEKTGSYAISRLRDVELGGYTGKGIDLTAPKAVEACPSRGFMMFADGQRVASASSNQRDALWILDVADLRLVVDAVSFPGTPTDALVAQQRLLDSIRIERVGANPPPTATAVRPGTIDAIAGLAISFDIPEGWSKTGETAYGRSVDRYPPRPPDGVEVSFWEVDEVLPRPCTNNYPSGRATGPTPADLASAFERVFEYDQSAPVDVSLSGRRGKSLRITLPDQLEGCGLPGRAVLWESHAQPPKYGLPGERDTLWILDVEGTRLVVDATSFAQTSSEDLAAQQQLIDSIRIERVDPAANSEPTFIDSIDGLRITYDLPDGWDASDVGARRLGSASNDVDVTFNIVDRVWQYPCQMPYLSNKSTTGTTPSDLTAKLRSAQGYTATEPSDTALAGYSGQRLQLKMPANLGGCHDSLTQLMVWIGQPNRFGSADQRDDLWILDVEGIRLVVAAMSFPKSPAEDLAAQQRLIDSIRIDRVGAAHQASPSPSPDQAPSEGGSGQWEAIDGLQITFDLPPGWSQPEGTGSTDRYPTPHVQGPNPGVAVNFYDEIDRAMPRPPAGPGVGPQDPGCRLPDGSNDDAGTTPADLAAKLQSDPHIEATKPVDVTLSGFKGKRLELQIPDPVSDCYVSPGIPLWIGRPTGFAQAGQRDTVWILDVRGKRVLIEAVSFPGTSAEDLAAQQRLIESIRITPTTP